ncbi:hypothetical protein BD94_1896 [Elizabethkingia anophelis NUHP1]|uniref:Uncharacterized protein n=1 Tax=Elizabethkingia anophelis NUHP1 TaxID=1338011 RepID=A0A077EDP2_9FLAO|nr:hypothetical protein BD94_1896 [Elizabethkingia anophelis NUHP1]
MGYGAGYCIFLLPLSEHHFQLLDFWSGGSRKRKKLPEI